MLQVQSHRICAILRFTKFEPRQWWLAVLISLMSPISCLVPSCMYLVLRNLGYPQPLPLSWSWIENTYIGCQNGQTDQGFEQVFLKHVGISVNWGFPLQNDWLESIIRNLLVMVWLLVLHLRPEGGGREETMRNSIIWQCVSWDKQVLECASNM